MHNPAMFRGCVREEQKIKLLQTHATVVYWNVADSFIEHRSPPVAWKLFTWN